VSVIRIIVRLRVALSCVYDKVKQKGERITTQKKRVTKIGYELLEYKCYTKMGLLTRLDLLNGSYLMDIRICIGHL